MYVSDSTRDIVYLILNNVAAPGNDETLKNDDYPFAWFCANVLVVSSRSDEQ